MSLLSHDASALCEAKNFDRRLGRICNAFAVLPAAILDWIVDERKLPAMQCLRDDTGLSRRNRIVKSK